MAGDWKREAIERYCRRLPEGLQTLYEYLVPILKPDSGATRPAVMLALSTVHRLAGATSMMGFLPLGALFSDLETALNTFLGADDGAREAQKKHIADLSLAVFKEGAMVHPSNSVLLASLAQGRPEPKAFLSIDSVLARQRTLIADDDLSIRVLVRGILVEFGVLDIELAASGREAIEVVRRKQPTLLILDWNMAPLSGVDVLSAVRGAARP